MVTDTYAETTSAKETAALQLTDALIGLPAPLDTDTADALRQHFSDAEIAELVMGVGLFHAMSKVLIILGLEPESMPTTVIPTPGSS